MASPFQIPNVRLFIWFRVLFGARFYYPIFTILFLDLGISLDQFALLNVAWAASIILLEVPSGALADIVGRRNLVVAAAGLMIFEMVVLILAPVGSSPLLFSLLLINRIASGAAEAAASGADEALAYDSLAEGGDVTDWPRVLERQMHATSIAFVVSSTVGATVYDPVLMNRVFHMLGGTAELSQALTLRFPIVLCLLAAIGAFCVALRMRDVRSPGAQGFRICREDISCALRNATRMTLRTGLWIFQTPAALVIILTGVTFDSMIRLFLTMSSQYYRVIQLPEASFGIIGSALSLLGLIIPGWAKRLTQTRSPRFNVLLMASLSWLGIWGLTFGTPYLGLLPVIPIFAAFFLLMFFMSHYLNSITDASRRATVLSFRGLVFNLGYAGIGILYSLLVALRRPEVRAENPDAEISVIEDLVFVDAMQYWPGYFLATLLLTAAFAAWKLRGLKHRGTPPATPGGAKGEEEKITE